MQKLKTLGQFAGNWQVDRVIKDEFNNAEGQLSGLATFTPSEAEVLLYAEEGELRYGGQPAMMATRRYIWRSAGGDASKKIKVTFEDGRPFHTISLDRLMPDDNHYCDPDFYHVSYDFTEWPKWRSAWRVVGPAKDYRMTTRYTRG